MEASPATEQLEQDNNGDASPKKLKNVARGILALVRAQGYSENGISHNFNATAVVSRIAMTLSSPETCTNVLTELFNEFSTPAQGGDNSAKEEEEPQLDLNNLPQIFAHWEIPEDLTHMFWSFWRKREAAWDLSKMPDHIGFSDFQAVMVKLLRRVRHLYCGHKVSKSDFIMQNRCKFEDEYVTSMKCGSGSFGECFWVIHRLSKRKRVCKKIPKEDVCIPPEELPDEVRVLQDMDHPNIVNVFEWFDSPTHYSLILEPAYGGDLKHLLAQYKNDTGSAGLKENLVHTITNQSLHALAYMHSKNLIHRDIKPANMLLAQTYDEHSYQPQVLLADFGVAEFFPQDHKMAQHGVKGTIGYMAPEVFEDSVCPRSDNWSLGIVIYELFCGERPYKPENSMAMYAMLKRKDPDFKLPLDVGATIAAVAFLKRLLVKDPQNRATAVKLLDDAWIAQPNFNQLLPGRQSRKIQKSVDAFMNTGYFSRVTMNCVAAQLNRADVNRLAQEFEAMDTDNNGVLSPQELAAGLHKMGVKDRDVQHLADMMDINFDGAIEYSEFVACLVTAQSQLVDDIAYNAFHIFDVNKNGMISLDELRLMLSGDGPLVAVLPDGKTVQQVLAEIDTSGDGQISFAEFKAYLQRESQGMNLAAKASASQDPKASPPASAASTLKKPDGANGQPEPQTATPTGEVDERLSESLLDESLSDFLKRCAPTLGRSEEEVLSWATYLADRHWLVTLRDVCRFRDAEWSRLDLPLRLESLLRAYLNTGKIPNLRSKDSVNGSFTSQPSGVSVSGVSVRSLTISKPVPPHCMNSPVPIEKPLGHEKKPSGSWDRTAAAVTSARKPDDLTVSFRSLSTPQKSQASTPFTPGGAPPKTSTPSLSFVEGYPQKNITQTLTTTCGRLEQAAQRLQVIPAQRQLRRPAEGKHAL